MTVNSSEGAKKKENELTTEGDRREWRKSEAARHPSIEAIRHGPMHTRIAPYTIPWTTEAQRARGLKGY